MAEASALSEQVLLEFHGLCNHAYDAWITHRTLFDDNERRAEFEEQGCAPFFSRLFDITQQYSLLQILKLHDPAVQQKRNNLTLEYVVRFGAWQPAAKAELEALKDELDRFATPLRILRNRTLSHSDLEAILTGERLGTFRAGEDEAYFVALKKFVTTANMHAFGKPLEFHEMAEGDVFMFLKRLRCENAW